MTMFKRTLAGVAAAALLVSQAATAAPSARAGTPIGQSEQLGEADAGLTPVLAVLAIFAIAAGIALISDDDGDDEPASP